MADKHKIVPPICCLHCGIKIEPMDKDEKLHDPYEMVLSSVVGFVYAGFGSENDGYIFQIGICDKCIEKLLEINRIKLIGDYIDSNVNAEIKKDLAKEGHSIRK